ncbi:MAG: diacylglycerol kinase family protein [Lachnospiraceae bacterium]|nr:diacylglycerol kinase family protein [Lachnospiraceae bacterium]
MKYIVLYNPLSNKERGLDCAKNVEKHIPGAAFEYADITKVKDFYAFQKDVPADTQILFTGGDGTLNHVFNDLFGKELDREIYYYPAGTGNDFVNDLGKTQDCAPFPVNEYLAGLPEVTVNGRTCRFLNAVGYGLDGYCCEESDRLKALGKEKAYSTIAIEGLLGKYKPTNAKVTVDGVTKTYKKVWMAPAMFGRYFGGGICMSPSQDRKNPGHLLTSVVVHDISRIPALLRFPAISAGKGESFTKFMDYRVGREIEVEFDSPVALQIDGETVLGVTGYSARACEA